jgi:hypothetical protein
VNAVSETGLHTVRQIVRGIGGGATIGSAIDLSVPVTLNSPFSITMSPSEASKRGLRSSWPA